MIRGMTPEQRRYFTIRPLVGYPLLLFRVLRENLRYIPIGQTKTEVSAIGEPIVADRSVDRSATTGGAVGDDPR